MAAKKTAAKTRSGQGAKKQTQSTRTVSAKETSVRVKNRRNTRAARARRGNAGDNLRTEIALWLLLAVSILLFLSNFNLAGSAGKAVGNIMQGVFGIMAYPFPFILFLGVSFIVANKESPDRWKMTVGAVMLLIFLCAFFQLVLAGYKSSLPVSSYYTAAKNGAIAGGVIGGIIVLVFAKPFGIAGAYILTLTALIISVVILVRKPLMLYFQRRSARAIRDAGTRRRERKKKRLFFEEEEEEQESNVDFDLRNLLGIADDGEKQILEDDKPRYIVRAREKKGSVSGDGLPESDKKSAGSVRETASGSDGAPSRNPKEGGAAGLREELEKKRQKGSLPEIVSASASENEIAGPEVVEDKAAKRSGKKSKGEAEKVDIRMDKADRDGYRLPDVSLLTPLRSEGGDSDEAILDTAEKLENTLRDFGVNVSITNVSRGPAVTRYELLPEHGVKVSRITSLIDDIKLSLAAADIRIEAPIPGKSAIGIEVPNKENSIVALRDLIDSKEFRSFRSKLAFAVGKDIGGNPVITDIKKMPHLLIAGATGSGKSVCINTLIMSVLFKATPEEVRMIMIDPKVIELSVYNGIPHLLLPVVTDPKKAAGALNWAVQEMDRRYKAFADIGVGIRDLGSYNMHIRKKRNDPSLSEEEKEKLKELPQILIIVDELADLMMVAPGDVEQSICRLTQLARAAGLHLVVATQRPSVNVITGLIKANMPSRIAFSVSSGVDSRTILDMVGAERLIGKGDMLFYPQGYVKPARVQGCFVPDEDVEAVVDFLKQETGDEAYSEEMAKEIENTAASGPFVQDAGSDDDKDDLFWDAGSFIIEKEKASIGMLQRVLKIGFNRAARIMDQLAEAGVVGEEEGTKPRRILMTMAEFNALRDGTTESRSDT